MSTYMMPSAQQFFDNNGDPLSGGKIYTCIAGASGYTEDYWKATYSDSAGTTPNTNPIVLDSAGRASIYGLSSAYKWFIFDSNDVSIETRDNVFCIQPVNGTVTIDADTLDGHPASYFEVAGSGVGLEFTSPLYLSNTSNTGTIDLGTSTAGDIIITQSMYIVTDDSAGITDGYYTVGANATGSGNAVMTGYYNASWPFYYAQMSIVPAKTKAYVTQTSFLYVTTGGSTVIKFNAVPSTSGTAVVPFHYMFAAYVKKQ